MCIRISPAYWVLSSSTHELIANDALSAHARDELGITAETEARPVMAALTSAVSLAIGAGLALVIVWLAPATSMILLLISATLVCLALLGACGALVGGAPVLPAGIRVLAWGALAMAAT
jgi:VIT1/CCC1 family predicted Fe2+/Mn2+ transporter